MEANRRIPLAQKKRPQYTTLPMDWLHAWYQQAFHITVFACAYYYHCKVAKKLKRIQGYVMNRPLGFYK